MQGRPRSHHPRALSGLRGEKPIRGAEERELSTKISPPERQPPILPPPPYKVVWSSHKVEEGGQWACPDVHDDLSLSLSSPRKPCILTILVVG